MTYPSWMICLLLFSTISVDLVFSSKILVILGFGSQSHRNVFNPLLEGLAARGHQLTVYSGYPFKNPIPNVNEIVMPEVKEVVDQTSIFNPFDTRAEGRALTTFKFLARIQPDFCENVVMKNKDLQMLRNTTEKYDLFITDILANECEFGFSWKLNIPMVIVSTSVIQTFTSESLGHHELSSIHPSQHLRFTETMSFFERVHNTIYKNFEGLIRHYFFLPAVDRLSAEYYGQGVPSVYELEKQASLVLINTHHSFGYPRPFPPNMVEVGAMHCRPSKPLPKDLEDYVNGSGKDGFILFTLGSVTQGSIMPEKYRKVFVEAFGRLKQRVLWKWETETMPDLPSNVKLVKWLPQQDLLGHPKIKAFVTHGGLLSSQEAAYHGVPLIGIPLYGDQDVNMNRAVNMGYAIKLELLDLTADELYNAIKSVITEKSYSINAKKRSSYMNDLIMKPTDTAVWWIEYVIRHKGADHLKLASRNLTLAQYYLWDVWGFIALCVLIPLTVLVYLIMIVFRARKPNKVVTKNNKIKAN